jgi:hypothetical protein
MEDQRVLLSIFYKNLISLLVAIFHLELAKTYYTLLEMDIVDNWFTNDIFDYD